MKVEDTVKSLQSLLSEKQKLTRMLEVFMRVKEGTANMVVTVGTNYTTYSLGREPINLPELQETVFQMAFSKIHNKLIEIDNKLIALGFTLEENL